MANRNRPENGGANPAHARSRPGSVAADLAGAGGHGGGQAPVDEVFAWNCRGDLVRSTSDGCTTAGISAEGELIIAHNEDGFPQLRGDCAIVHVTPDVGLAFTSFAYPGSLCGHTFAVNEKGIVNTVNNIRAVHRPEGMPRQILARASLNATTLDEAITLLTATRARARFTTHWVKWAIAVCLAWKLPAPAAQCAS